MIKYINMHVQFIIQDTLNHILTVKLQKTRKPIKIRDLTPNWRPEWEYLIS